MSIFSLFRWRRRATPQKTKATFKHVAQTVSDAPNLAVTRHFYNENGFQCFATFFPLWNGWATAGHVLTDAAHAWPEFTRSGEIHLWPGGVDAALKACTLPAHPPNHPKAGQRVRVYGYPAGSRHLEVREGTVYIERGTGSGTWIIHIRTPDEPVVSGMSGGPVIDIETGKPIGIVITRNSPADLNADRDPDESCDFVALSNVWNLIQESQRMS